MNCSKPGHLVKLREHRRLLRHSYPPHHQPRDSLVMLICYICPMQCTVLSLSEILASTTASSALVYTMAI